MDKFYAQYLLKKTGEDYDLIADQFSSSRHSAWPEFNILGQYIKEEEKVLDLGCGNGRLFGLFKDKNIDYTGVDNSIKLIEWAKKKYPDGKFQVVDALNLPFPNNDFDKIFCIAVFHHIPSEELRSQFLKEAKRVLKPGGLLILTVWNLWQRKTGWRLLLKYTFSKLIGKSRLDFKDIFYPWKSSGGKTLIQRYFHLFSKNSLKKLISGAGFKIKEADVFKREEAKNYNIYIIAEK